MLISGAVAERDHIPSFESFLACKPVAPVRELCAYEALWLSKTATVKTIADLFARNAGALPSDLASEDDIEDARRRLVKRLGEQGLREVGLRVHGAGEYPQRLRVADHPAEVLYFKGDWELIESPCVAVVGTREPTAEGAEHTRRIVAGLVHDGFTVVSGLARGVDTIAHTTALECGGRTIAVTGAPLDVAYPSQNAELQATIAKSHLVVTQVPFLRYHMQSMTANKWFFPERNVTMSALTMGTVIVEAGETSGTLHQARAAVKQQRKLFILESAFRNAKLTWPAKYEAKGAIRVSAYRDLRDGLSDAVDRD